MSNQQGASNDMCVEKTQFIKYVLKRMAGAANERTLALPITRTWLLGFANRRRLIDTGAGLNDGRRPVLVPLLICVHCALVHYRAGNSAHRR
jgi:hypothetical protein